jgi:hypothetical protein
VSVQRGASSLSFSTPAHLIGHRAETSATLSGLDRPAGASRTAGNRGGWETADRYLSGDVRAKLAVARATAGLDPRYEENADALAAVQQADLESGDIEARLGSSWIATTDIRDFIAGLLSIEPRQVRLALRRDHCHLHGRD